jgi:outer membrane protein assembly factor BamB
MVIDVAGRQQLISPTSKATLAYDPRTGEELWRVRYQEFSATARPLFGHGLLFINTGFSKAKFLAVVPDGSGDVTESHVRWQASKSIGSKPSPIMVGDLIFIVHDAGTLVCLEAATGAEVWNKRLGGQYSASPIQAGGHLYFCSQEGRTAVIKPAREFQMVATNVLDDGCMSSPAASGDTLILRTRSHIYRLEDERKSP